MVAVQLHEHVYLLVEGRCSLLRSKTTHADQHHATHTKQQQQHAGPGPCTAHSSFGGASDAIAPKPLRSFALHDSTLVEEAETAAVNSITTAGSSFTASASASSNGPVIIDFSGTLCQYLPAGGALCLHQASPCTAGASDAAQGLAAPTPGSKDLDEPGIGPLQTEVEISSLLYQRRVTGQYNERLKHSGDVFNMAALNVFGVYIGFDQGSDR